MGYSRSYPTEPLPLRGAPTRISGKFKVFYTSIKNSIVRKCTFLDPLYSATIFLHFLVVYFYFSILTYYYFSWQNQNLGSKIIRRQRQQHLEPNAHIDRIYVGFYNWVINLVFKWPNSLPHIIELSSVVSTSAVFFFKKEIMRLY